MVLGCEREEKSWVRSWEKRVWSVGSCEVREGWGRSERRSEWEICARGSSDSLSIALS